MINVLYLAKLGHQVGFFVCLLFLRLQAKHKFCVRLVNVYFPFDNYNESLNEYSELLAHIEQIKEEFD